MKPTRVVVFGTLVLASVSVLALVWAHDTSSWAKAETIKQGMTKDQVLQIMGQPKTISKAPPGWHATEEWRYYGPRKFRIVLSLRPLRASIPQPEDWITIGFTEDEKVFSVWIPTMD
jgi:hypothetical protein